MRHLPKVSVGHAADPRVRLRAILFDPAKKTGEWQVNHFFAGEREIGELDDLSLFPLDGAHGAGSLQKSGRTASGSLELSVVRVANDEPGSVHEWEVGSNSSPPA